MLNAQDIIAEAEEIAGLDDADRHLHRNLEALVRSVNDDGKLTASSEPVVRRGLVVRSADRLEGLKWLKNYPEISEERIVDPVILTGLPRSGGTYFQYIFDRDRRFRCIRTWESLTPNPPPGFDAQSVVRRKAQEAQRRRELQPKEIEGFEALHLLDLDGSDECHIILEQSYSSTGFFNLYDAPSYFDFLMNDLDLEAAYAVHRRQLQLLQWRMPQPRWAVKVASHAIAMNEILKVYPGARFAITHRDPLQVLGSIAKMTRTLRSVRYDAPIDAHRVGRQMLHFIRRQIDRIMEFCSGPNDRLVTHVDYYDLLADPAAKMREIHESLGLDTPEDVAQEIVRWRRENPKNARGANEYTLEEFGIRPEEALELYGDYMRRFNIPREHDGLARVGLGA